MTEQLIPQITQKPDFIKVLTGDHTDEYAINGLTREQVSIIVAAMGSLDADKVTPEFDAKFDPLYAALHASAFDQNIEINPYTLGALQGHMTLSEEFAEAMLKAERSMRQEGAANDDDFEGL